MVSVVLVPVLSLLADIHYVDANNVTPATPFTNWASASRTIQWALDQAATGDMVLVTNGTYWVTNQINVTNGVLFRSVDDNPGRTILARDPGSTTRVMRVSSALAVVSGFSVSNGLLTGTADGAGVYVDNGTISNCVIMGNVLNTTFPPLTYGGGLYMVTGTVVDCVITGNSNLQVSARGIVTVMAGLVKHCTIAHNTGGEGGGLWMASGLIQGCRIERNRSAGKGAGVRINGVVTMETSCVLSNSLLTQSDGAGIYVSGGPVVIRNCTNSYNVGTWQQGGGGFYVAVSNVLIENCVITHNSGAGYGGGVFFAAGGLMRNCLIAGNQVDMYGGGGVASEGPLTIENCTISRNKGSEGTATRCNAGGLFLSTGSVVNCVIYSNTSDTAGKEANFNFTDSVAISNTCGVSSTLVFPHGLNGNFTNAPRFVAEGAGFGASLTGGDFRLGKGSPCVDRGQNLAWMRGALALDGAKRIRNSTVDVGAYEQAPPAGTVVYIY